MYTGCSGSCLFLVKKLNIAATISEKLKLLFCHGTQESEFHLHVIVFFVIFEKSF